MHYAILSDIGKKRTVNEDRAAFFTHRDRKQLTLAAIADGMGGHRGGDYASTTAVKLIGQSFLQLTIEEIEELDWAQWLETIIQQVNYRLFDIALRNDKYQGMGTTLDLVLLDGRQCYVAHVGDSRVYMVKHRHIQQLTKDHSFVNALLESGEITEEEAIDHPQRNWIVRAVGSERRITVDIQTYTLEEDATILLCTDGLSNLLSSEEMLTVVTTSSLSLQQKAERLIERANENGGDDNISVILIEWTAEEVKSR